MEHVNGWCFRGIYKGGLWEDDLHVSAPKVEMTKDRDDHKPTVFVAVVSITHSCKACEPNII